MNHFKASRGFKKTALFFAIAGAALAAFSSSIPLLNVAGYELAAVSALFLAVACGSLGIVAGADTSDPGISPRHSTWHLSNVKYSQAVFAGLTVLALIYAISAYSTIVVQKCNLAAGAYLFFWITIPTALHYAAVGLAAGRVCRGKIAAGALVLLYFLLTCAHSFAVFMDGSRWTMPNLTVGLFTDAGFYGLALIPPPGFIPSRLLVVLTSLFFIGAAAAANPQAHTSRLESDIYFARRAILFSAAVFLFCFIFFPDQTGAGSNKRYVSSVMSATVETPNAVVFYDPSSLTKGRAERAARFAEWYIHEINEAIPMPESRRARVMLYADNEQKLRLTGAADYLFSAPWRVEVHMTDDRVDDSVFKHELTHALMSAYGRGVFGTPYNMGVVEGIAEAVEQDFFRGLEFQENFAAAVKAGAIAPASKTMSTAGFGSSSMWKSYEMAGAFTGFLIYKYGQEKYTEYYASPNPEKVYGKTISELNDEWIEWLSGMEVSAYALRIAQMRYDDEKYPAFYKKRCPRIGPLPGTEEPWAAVASMMEDGEYTKSAELCEETHSKDGNADWLVKKAKSLLKAGRYDEAAESARSVMASKKATNEAKDSAMAALAAAHAATGKFEAATAALKEREAFGFAKPGYVAILIEAMNRPAARDALLPAMINGIDFEPGAVRRAIEAEPDFVSLHSQLALNMNSQDFASEEEFLKNLSKATLFFVENAPGFDSLKLKTLINLGDKYTDARRYDEAENAYRFALKLNLVERERFTAERRIERTVFFKELAF
jgi:tetratricopeptide (TPR) repeat protein